MRRLEFLLNEVRRSTDTIDTTAVTDAEIIGYYEYGQKLIQSIIFRRNPKADIFKSVVTYNATNEGVYELPEDIYAVNSLSLVEVQTGSSTINDGFVKIDRIDESEQANLFGYFTRDNKLILSGNQQNVNLGSIRVTYAKQLPKFDKRWGTIQTVNPGVSLVLSAGYDPLAETVDEYVTVVNSSGTIIKNNILISSFSGGTWSTSDALTGVAPGMFVCMGKDATTVSPLPNECETYLQDYVRQRIYTRNNYNDANKQVYFTDKQEEDMSSLFSKNTTDIIYPPISDLTYLEF